MSFLGACNLLVSLDKRGSAQPIHPQLVPRTEKAVEIVTTKTLELRKMVYWPACCFSLGYALSACAALIGLPPFLPFSHPLLLTQIPIESLTGSLIIRKNFKKR